jgi:hypothetical protein
VIDRLVSPRVQELAFTGAILRRGFWLYVWEITPPVGTKLYYVGRTGDSSSTNAQSPFNRMGQHLGFASNSNMLRRHLLKLGFEPEQCSFRLVALGPLAPESKGQARLEHDRRRDAVAAMEKALAQAMTAAGYEVMNKVDSRKALDAERFGEVRAGFAKAFPMLAAR